MLIGEFLLSFDFSRRHETIVAAEPARVYKSVRNLNFEASGITKALFRMRGLPMEATSLDQLQQMGFVLLGEQENREFVLGIVGKFWTPSGQIQWLTPEEFKDFQTVGYAKAAWNFSLLELGPGTTRLSTETRILCIGKESIRFFRLYWFFISPFSGLIRKEFLRSIQQQVRGSAVGV